MEDNNILCKSIISEMIGVIKDESFPIDFRNEIKAELLEIKEEIEKLILEYS